MTPILTTTDYIERDRWGRPLILPVDPDFEGDPIPYTRVSTMAKTLDDTTALTAWKLRTLLVGMAYRPDLSARVAGVINAHPSDPVAGGKTVLNEVAKTATEAGGGSKAASLGSALHDLTAAVDQGTDPDDVVGVTTEVRRRLRQYAEATTLLDVVAVETFVVVDPLCAAGTLDRLYRLPDGRVVVGDIKTGSSDDNYPLSVATQVAAYAHGALYNPRTGARRPLHDDLDPTTGLLIHLPQKMDGCRVWELDLVAGWEAAKTAAQVHAIRRLRAGDLAAAWEA